MPLNISRNQEALDRNSDSRFPLISGTTARDSSGSFELPNDLLVSLMLPVPEDLEISPISAWVSRVVVSPNFLQLYISARIMDEPAQIARADVSMAAAEASIRDLGYAFASLDGVGLYSDLRGHIQLARLDSLRRQPVGVFDFAYEGSALEPDCIRPEARQVPAVEIETAPGQFARLTGLVRFRPGSNMRFRVATENSEPVVYIDAIDPTDLNEQLECDGGTTKPIYRINSIPADAQGNFQLGGSRCLDITPATFGVAMRNNCSEPCAGCTEAEALSSRVKAMEQQLPQFTTFLATLSSQVSRMIIATDLSTAVTECQTLGGDVAP